jgi:hypothetical protein
LAGAGRVRYAVATGGNASWNSEAGCHRSPAHANKRRDYPSSTMKPDGFVACYTPRKRVGNWILILNSRVSPFVPDPTLGVVWVNFG